MKNGKPSTSPTFDPQETLDFIEDDIEQVIMAPWYGAMVPVKVRRLNEAQISACGNISLIETFEDKIRRKKELNMREIIAYADRYNRLVQEALVAPTYKQIMTVIGRGKKILEAKKLLAKLKEKLRSTPNKDGQRQALEEEIANMRLWVNYILPEDFLGTIVSWALRRDDTDIKKLTDEMLLECAILAERGHDNPHDHCEGRFTAFNKKDIDKRAWEMLDNERKKKRA